MNKIERQILEKALAEKEETENKWKKPLVIVIGVFLLILILGYFALGPEFYAYVEGRIATQEIGQDSSLMLKNEKRVVFHAETYELLKRLYAATQTHEFKACLEGYKEGTNYYVTGMYIPKTYSESVYHVTAELCNASTIVSLHSHPPDHCLFSDADKQSHEYFRQINREGLSGMMCGEKRFGLYG